MKSLLLALILLLSTWSTAQDTVHIGISVAEINATEKIYNFYVRDYPDCLAFQYSMFYNETKMTFARAQQFTLQQMGPNDFHIPQPGSLVSAWIDPFLNGYDFTDSTLLFQLVFDLVEPGGSPLCFSDMPLNYEFIQGDMEDGIKLSYFIVHDECYEGLVLIDNTSSIDENENEPTAAWNKAALSVNGELQLNLEESRQISFRLCDALGRTVAATGEHLFNKGHNAILFPVRLPVGIFYLQGISEGQVWSEPVLAH